MTEMLRNLKPQCLPKGSYKKNKCMHHTWLGEMHILLKKVWEKTKTEKQGNVYSVDREEWNWYLICNQTPWKNWLQIMIDVVHFAVSCRYARHISSSKSSDLKKQAYLQKWLFGLNLLFTMVKVEIAGSSCTTPCSPRSKNRLEHEIGRDACNPYK